MIPHKHHSKLSYNLLPSAKSSDRQMVKETLFMEWAIFWRLKILAGDHTVEMNYMISVLTGGFQGGRGQAVPLNF